MARHQTHSSDQEDHHHPSTKLKENRMPILGSKQQVASNKRKPMSLNAKSKATNNKKTTNAIIKERFDDDDEEEEEAEEEEIVAETQFADRMEIDPVKIGGKKGNPKSVKGKKNGRNIVKEDEESDEDDDGEEERLSSRERRLIEKLELTQTALKQTKEALGQITEMRYSKAEESEKELMEIASERQTAAMKMIENYKHENDSLRNELSTLRARRAAGINVTDGERVEELLHVIEGHGEEKQALQARIAELEEFANKAEMEERRKLQERDHHWQKEIERTVRAKDDQARRLNGQLETELHQARQELEAEIEHSKTLLARNKATPVLSSSTTASTSDSLKLGRVVDELSTVQKQLNLSEDLTGFTVVSVKNEEGFSVYSAILNDYLGMTGGLTFKLAFYNDGTCGYTPNVDPERDAVLADLLPQEMQRYMRFDAENCSEWFRRLWFAVNKLKA